MTLAALRRGCPVFVALSAALSLSGCAASSGALRPGEVQARHTVSEIDDERIAYVEDPWEGFNRSMYKFNYYFDRYLFLPVVNTYEFITPTFFQSGVSNFFNNIGEVRNLINCVFQLKGTQSMRTLGRFAVNTTLGVGGLLDPATDMGLRRQDEDFGQTLGYWGVGSGPYLVLPVLGPSTVRSASGYAVDFAIRSAIVNAVDPFEDVEHGSEIQTGLTILEAVDRRHQESFRYYDSSYPFEYYIVRFLYREKRELMVTN